MWIRLSLSQASSLALTLFKLITHLCVANVNIKMLVPRFRMSKVDLIESFNDLYGFQASLSVILAFQYAFTLQFLIFPTIQVLY